eukprot:TRINITY_DN10029_c0_g1_i1.p1 TRINITY_DN10029_c0_g1~~TRINITY_DN10029_c0_g1_i1.p1  ORF type:complete len:146 (+),score=34.50 TRINITY_DN10029_c0_g1_i1:51-440(+)
MQAFIFSGSIILLLVSLSQAYPGGAPSCTATPGHGANKGDLAAAVQNIGGNNWQVTISGEHKGLVLNAKTKGTWDPAVEGYQKKGTCITHSSRSNKDTNSFVFRAREEGTPKFSGFVVINYANYKGLAF